MSPDYDSTLKLIGSENSHESLYQSPRRFTGAKEEKRRQHLIFVSSSPPSPACHDDEDAPMRRRDLVPAATTTLLRRGVHGQDRRQQGEQAGPAGGRERVRGDGEGPCPGRQLQGIPDAHPRHRARQVRMPWHGTPAPAPGHQQLIKHFCLVAFVSP